MYLSASDFLKEEWIDQSVKILSKNKNVESVFSGHATHKNFWEFRNNKWQRLKKSMKVYSSRQVKKPIFEKILV